MVFLHPGVQVVWEHLPYITDLVNDVKSRILLGTVATQNDVYTFMTWVFHRWRPGNCIKPPANNTAASLGAVGVKVGLLARDAPASSSQAGTARPRDRASQLLVMAEDPSTDKPHRKEGSPIYPQAQWAPSRGLSFTMKDKKSGFISETTPFHYLYLPTRDHAGMNGSDQWWSATCRLAPCR